jgi:peptidyl-prolyl cis-trans isomerase SurA
MKRVILLATCLAASSAALLAQSQAPPPAPARDPIAAPGQHRVIQRVLVRVNGEVFTQTQLERLEVDALRTRKIAVDNPADLQNDVRLRALLDEVTPDILVQSVDELLLVQYGKELGYHVSDEQFKTTVDGFKKENKLTDAELKTELAAAGLTMDGWRDVIEHTLIIQDVQRNEILPKAQLTEEELHQYYNAHHNEFMTPATMTFREILIEVPTVMQNNQAMVNAAAAEDALKRVTAIRDRIVQGEDFAKVAAEVSESSTKGNGGLLGTFNLEDIDPSLRKQVENLKAGEVTPPLRTQRGYQLLKADAVTPAELKPFDSVRDELRTKVGNSRMDVEQRKFLVKVRANALIEWKDQTLKSIYEKRVAEQMAGK